MTVKELITQLLNCDMDKQIYIADDVGFENEFGDWVRGSMYDIENIEEGNNVYLKFDNRNHRLKDVAIEALNKEPCEELDFVQPHKKMSVNLETSEWTPVSESFPEENGRYFVTVKLGYVTTAMWAGIAEDWDKVIAWMPFFPKPYKTSPTEVESEVSNDKAGHT